MAGTRTPLPPRPNTPTSGKTTASIGKASRKSKVTALIRAKTDLEATQAISA